jgi:hypothetical protein
VLPCEIGVELNDKSTVRAVVMPILGAILILVGVGGAVLASGALPTNSFGFLLAIAAVAVGAVALVRGIRPPRDRE